MERVEQLAALIAEQSGRDTGYVTPLPGLYLTKVSTAFAPRHLVDRALFCVVAQGAKRILLDERSYECAANQYLLVSLDLPLVGEFVEASPQKPCFCITLELDVAAISALLLEVDLPEVAGRQREVPIFVSDLDGELLDALIRLVCVLKKPAQIPILAPMIKREIYYRLLLGEQSGLLRRIASSNGAAERIAAGIGLLKRNLARPVRSDELARELNMSVSNMHAWFKSVTSLSPLQYHKKLRLQEARLLLLAGTADASLVGQQVGYESPSQFSRDYRRMFGAPPVRDAERIRSSAGGLNAPARKIEESQ